MYNEPMEKDDRHRELMKIGTAEERFREALRLHEIEGNPLDDEQIAMFEMFRSEGWSHEMRRKFLIQRATSGTQSDESE